MTAESPHSAWFYRSALPAVFATVAIAAAGCGSSASTSSVTTGPTPAKCQITLTATTNVVADGGTGTISVGAQPECEWSVSTQTSWISDLLPASGQGNGKVDFRAAPNAGASTREGEVVINDSRVRIMQEAAPCRFTLTPTEQTVSSVAGEGSVAVGAPSGCTWGATSSAPFITITSGASGSGNGTVTFRVLANSGNSRTGTLTIADRTHTVTQLAPGAAAPPPTQPCTFTINPTAVNVAGEGGSATATVAAAANCTWTAASNDQWITVTSGASGNGSGTVGYTVAANTGGGRNGTLTIAGQMLTITQAAAPPPTQPCTFTINPTAVNVAGEGGSATATVAAAANCTWTAASNDQWITVTSGASGNGSGTVGYTVAANTGGGRNGTLTIAGQMLTITQAAVIPTCTYTINPTTANVAAGAGAGPSATVTTTAGCTWTAASNDQWITVTSGASGSGNGTVGYTVAANTGGARNGSLTIAGHTFSVAQAAPAPSCNYSINPTSANAAAGGGAGPAVTVTTTAGCSWTAVRNDQWITVTSGASGNGNGTVGYTVAANTGGARNGTLTIAGHTFSVAQAAPAPSCNYSINPTSANAAAGGGAGPAVTVTTTAGCGWTAVRNDQWITVTSGASGNGNGTVGYTVAANTGGARNGTLTIAGHTFSVAQAAPAPSCNYSINPNSVNAPAGGGAGPSVTVTTTAGCPWTAASNVSWLTVTSGASGNGNGTVSYMVAANNGAARNGTLTIAGRTFTVMQAQTCTYTIDPTSATFSRMGGNDNVRVSAANGCAWTATTSAPWINIIAGSSDTGNGMVRYIVAPNTGQARSGTITIAGRTFTVAQNGIGGRLGGSHNDVTTDSVGQR